MLLLCTVNDDRCELLDPVRRFSVMPRPPRTDQNARIKSDISAESANDVPKH